MQPTPVRFLALVLTLGLLACSAPLLEVLQPTPTPTPSTTPSPTPTPTATPTATPAPESLLEEANWAAFIGDWPQAIDLYRSAGEQSSDSAVAGAAKLGLGSALLRAGRTSEAQAELSAYLRDFPDHSDRGLALFLRAVAFEQQDDLPRALADYGAFLEAAPGRIDAYVLEKLGDILRQLDRPREAIEQYQRALTAPSLQSPLLLEIKIGIAYFEADDYGPSLSQFEKVYELAPDAPTKATANLLQGRVYEALGQEEDALARYLDSFDNYPTAYDTYLGLIEIVAANMPVDPFRRGLVDYYAGAFEPGLRAFNRAEETEPSPALYYYRGLTLRELDDPQGARQDFLYLINTYPDASEWTEAWFELAWTEWLYLDLPEAAIQTYLTFVETSPSSDRAPEALDRAGIIAERIGFLDVAADHWLRLVDQYPNSDRAHSAAFRAGVIRTRQLRHEEAEGAFNHAFELALDAEQRSAAQFWIGKSRQSRGEGDSAREAWLQASAEDPTGYYSERAQDLLEGRSTFESKGLLQLPSDPAGEQAEAEAWLRQQFGYDSDQPIGELGPSLEGDDRLLRGETFWRLGLFGLAREEFENLRLAVATDPIASYQLMHHMLDLGLYRPAIFAARSVLDQAGLDDAGTLTAPIYFNHVRFGLYYGDLILPAAQEQGFDPLLLFSVVRQESLFEGFATSYAEARGLMQVIPSTGADIAAQLGWPPGYEQDDLYRPVVSVRFGSYYLAQQRELFDGNLVVALSAYNAGPGNALAWSSLAPTDPDLYVEIMRIEQPQEYVRSIYEVYRIYQGLYIDA